MFAESHVFGFEFDFRQAHTGQVGRRLVLSSNQSAPPESSALNAQRLVAESYQIRSDLPYVGALTVCSRPNHI